MRVPLIVAKIFDSSIFGESVQQIRIHSKQHLIEENGHIIPAKVGIFTAGCNS